MYDSDKTKKILVTGATGYVGGRLISNLLKKKYTIRVLVRNPERLKNKSWYKKVEIYTGDVLDKKSIQNLFKNIDIAFYLIHSMQNSINFEKTDLVAANNFASIANKNKIKKIIYLGGLAENEKKLSKHLRSRHETGIELSKHSIDVIEFRANVIVGSGSLSFEMIRNLTERLPVMLCPKWLYTKTQPIAIANIMDYLSQSIELEKSGHTIIDIGGKNILTYGDMIKVYAKVRKLKRLLISIPLLTPKLSSYWVHWTTPLSANITKPLIEGLKNESIVKNNLAMQFFPDIKLLSYEKAVKKAIENSNNQSIETSWSDSLSSSKGNDSNVSSYLKEGMIIETRTIKIKKTKEDIFNFISSIGGKKGWLYANFLWVIRGYIDLLVGGVGLRRGRRHLSELKQGDALDFWRVEKIVINHLVRLKAEMKLPGKAWLEYEILEDEKKCTLIQKAYFMPTGLFGLFYWYSLYPIHKIIFSGLIKTIKSKVEFSN